MMCFQERFHVCCASIRACMLCRRMAPIDAHFTRTQVQPTFVTLTMWTAPDHPVAIAVAGAVVRCFRKVGKFKFAHFSECLVL